MASSNTTSPERLKVRRQGLTKLYSPLDDTPTIAVVIFVHGLLGHPKDTWTWTATDNHFWNRPKESEQAAPEQVFWPQELLPSAISDVGIFTWGYDADVSGWDPVSQNTISQHARNLLVDITNLRERHPDFEKPIIFVAYGLGRIIVKAALNLSRSTEGTALRCVAPATSGICFLGTPHRGSSSASLGLIACNIAQAILRKPNKNLLKGLERSSELLDNIGEDFGQTLIKYAPKLRIFSFREEKPNVKLRVFKQVVVPAYSAKIGDPYEETGSIPENHTNLARFDGPDSVGFDRVRAPLCRWVNGLRNNDVPPRDIDDCIASLSTIGTNTRIDEIRRIRIDAVQEAHRTTFHWLYDPAMVSFSEWLRNASNAHDSLYWIRGKPGSGKSTLMKFAMKDARTSDILAMIDGSQWTFAAFFFHDRGSQVQKSFTGMLQGIIDSLLRELPELTTYAVPQYRRLVQLQATRCPTWDMDALKSVLQEIIGQRVTNVRLLLFVDALDEQGRDKVDKSAKENLVKFLQKLGEEADNDCVRLKLCLASRPEPVFEHHLSRAPGFTIQEYTKDDIRVYTEKRLEPYRTEASVLNGLENFENLVDQVTKRAEGVFIWVKLVVDQLAQDICDCSSYMTLIERLKAMPQELGELYSRILERLEPAYASEACIMLLVALTSLEQLPLETFMRAVTFGFHSFREHLINQRHYKTSFVKKFFEEEESQIIHIRRLASRSGGLLETYTTGHGPKDILYVQFLHQTAKDYINERHGDLPIPSLDPVVQGLNGFYWLLLACMSCNSWVGPIKKHMFEYATQVERHAAGRYRGEMKDLPLKVMWTGPSNNEHGDLDLEWWLKSYAPWLHSDDPLFRKNDTDREFKHIILAVAANLPYVVRLIMDREPLFAKGSAALDPSEIRDPTCLVQYAAVGPAVVPLHFQDRAGMIKVLHSLKHPIDSRCKLFYYVSNVSDNFDSQIPSWSPLAAIVAGTDYSSDLTRYSIMNVLLELGADCEALIHLRYADSSYSRNMPLLSYCVENRSVEVVRLLLEHGADCYRKDSIGLRAIHYAILRQDREIMRAFEEHKPNNQPAIFPKKSVFELGTKTELLDKDETAMLSAVRSSAFLGFLGHPVSAMLAKRRVHEQLETAKDWNFGAVSPVWARNRKVSAEHYDGGPVVEDKILSPVLHEVLPKPPPP